MIILNTPALITQIRITYLLFSVIIKCTVLIIIKTLHDSCVSYVYTQHTVELYLLMYITIRF